MAAGMPRRTWARTSTKASSRCERVTHHRSDVGRAGRLIQGPEGLGAIGVERRLRELARREAALIEARAEARASRAAPVPAGRAQIDGAPAGYGAGRGRSRRDPNEPSLIGSLHLAVVRCRPTTRSAGPARYRATPIRASLDPATGAAMARHVGVHPVHPREPVHRPAVVAAPSGVRSRSAVPASPRPR